MNISLNEVSQFAHVGWGYLIVTVLTLLLHVPLLISAGLLIAGAGIKEYWDCHGLETDADSGGVSGSWQDFGFWALGAGVAALVLITSGR